MAARIPAITRSLLAQLDAIDLAIYEAVAATPPRRFDLALSDLSNSGDQGQVWLGIAAGLMVFGTRRQRRAAKLGLAAVVVTSVAVDLVAKRAFLRNRPNRTIRPATAHVRMPRSTSFPSGHSASAFAFASAVGGELPGFSVPLGMLATGVAYSRVSTGVHYPSDVVVGSVLGAFAGAALRRLAARRGAVRAPKPHLPDLAA